MTTFSFTVAIHKKNAELFPVRLSVYRQCKIIKATDKNDADYYLFFYKDNFLHAVQLDQVTVPSFLNRALAHGISFPGSHPLTEALLESNSPLHSSKLSLLFKKIQEKYRPIETTLLLSFFDVCLPSETIHKQFRKTFYFFRRNGQLLAAYQLLQFYRDFDPQDSFANDMLNNVSFNRYVKRYQDISNITDADSTYLEMLCFNQLPDSDKFKSLTEIYQEESRWVDELAVRSEYLLYDKSKDNLGAILQLAARNLEDKQQTSFLQSLLPSLPETNPVRRDILHRLIRHGDPIEVIHFLLEEPVQINADTLPFVTESFLNSDPSAYLPSVEKLNGLLLRLYQNDSQTLEKITSRIVTSMLGSYDVPFIKAWLSEYSKAGIQLPIAKKLENMESFQEDPDKQFALGELYLYFHQYRKSIDCFKWEMELKPEDPKPVQYLSKVYSALGEKEEAKAYSMLLGQLNKKQV